MPNGINLCKRRPLPLANIAISLEGIEQATGILKAVTDFLETLQIDTADNDSIDIIKEIKKILSKLTHEVLEYEELEEIEDDIIEELDEDEELEEIELDEGDGPLIWKPPRLRQKKTPDTVSQREAHAMPSPL